MTFEKQVVVDSIETLENGCVQVRTATRVLEDGNVISQTYHRHVVSPCDDYSQEEPKVQDICSVIHTPDVIAEYKVKQAEQQIV